MKKYVLFLGILTFILSLHSCIIPKKNIYLKDMKVDAVYDVAKIPPIIIQPGDRLNIVISSRNPELALPFNQIGGVYQNDGKGEFAGPNSAKGYLVNPDGNIDFPILGEIKVEELSIEAIKALLKTELRSKKLIGDPVIEVELANLKVIMIGEAGNQIITSATNQLTLLEAIVKSGGLQPNAKNDEILVIREENGLRRMYKNDIRSVDFFNSPTYYLQQNDIVYVRPRSAVMTPREQMTWQYIGWVTSLVTLGVSLLALFSIKN